MGIIGVESLEFGVRGYQGFRAYIWDRLIDGNIKLDGTEHGT